MLSLLHAAALMMTTTPAITAPAGCPDTAAEADAVLKQAADTSGIAEMQRMIGRYEPVAIERLGVVSKKAYRQQSGLSTKHLSDVNFYLDGALPDYHAAFLAAHPARKKFKVDCTDERCSWRPADGNDLNEDRIDKLVPKSGLYMARISPSKDKAGQVILSCIYRGP